MISRSLTAIIGLSAALLASACSYEPAVKVPSSLGAPRASGVEDFRFPVMRC